MTARATSIALIAAGMLLIWPLDPVLGGVSLAALGAILAARRPRRRTRRRGPEAPPRASAASPVTSPGR
jgi:hypothetical protein